MTTIDSKQVNSGGLALHRFTRDEYYQMADLGFFADKRVELLHGEIVDMAPQKSDHFVAIELAAQALKRAFGEAYWVRTQGPMTLGDSEPEPDIAVVPGNAREYRAHPKSALLIVEVSDTTLRLDRSVKASIYASAGIGEYWILNLVERCVEVHRAPAGGKYGDVAVVKAGEELGVLAKGGAVVKVDDLLP